MFVSQVDVSFVIDQQFETFQGPGSNSVVKWGLAIQVLDVHVSVGIEDHLKAVDVVEAGHLVKDRFLILVPRVDVGSGPDQNPAAVFFFFLTSVARPT